MAVIGSQRRFRDFAFSLWWGCRWSALLVAVRGVDQTHGLHLHFFHGVVQLHGPHGVGFVVVEGVGHVICPCHGWCHLHCLPPLGHGLCGLVRLNFCDLLGVFCDGTCALGMHLIFRALCHKF